MNTANVMNISWITKRFVHLFIVFNISVPLNFSLSHFLETKDFNSLKLKKE